MSCDKEVVVLIDGAVLIHVGADILVVGEDTGCEVVTCNENVIVLIDLAVGVDIAENIFNLALLDCHGRCGGERFVLYIYADKLELVADLRVRKDQCVCVRADNGIVCALLPIVRCDKDLTFGKGDRGSIVAASHSDRADNVACAVPGRDNVSCITEIVFRGLELAEVGGEDNGIACGDTLIDARNIGSAACMKKCLMQQSL